MKKVLFLIFFLRIFVQAYTWEYYGSSNFITDFVIVDTARLWAASSDGLLFFNLETEEIKKYDENNGIVNPYLIDIDIDKNNNIWAVSNNYLSKFNINSREFVNYNILNDKNIKVLCMKLVNDTAFVGTNKGLYFFTEEHGLQYVKNLNTIILRIASFNNKLYLATITGIYILDDLAIIKHMTSENSDIKEDAFFDIAIDNNFLYFLSKTYITKMDKDNNIIKSYYFGEKLMFYSFYRIGVKDSIFYVTTYPKMQRNLLYNVMSDSNMAEIPVDSIFCINKIDFINDDYLLATNNGIFWRNKFYKLDNSVLHNQIYDIIRKDKDILFNYNDPWEHEYDNFYGISVFENGHINTFLMGEKVDFLVNYRNTIFAFVDKQIYTVDTNGLHLQKMLDDQPIAYYTDQDGKLWIYTYRDKLQYASDTTLNFKTYFRNFLVNYEINVYEYITAIAITSFGKKYVGSLNGLCQISFDKSTKMIDYNNSNLEDNFITCLKQISDTSIFIGTAVGGLYELDKNENIKKIKLKEADYMANISSIYVDSSNTIWVTTLGDGIFYKKNDIWYKIDRENGLLDENVNSLARIGNKIYIATLFKGLQVLDLNTVDFIENKKYEVGSESIDFKIRVYPNPCKRIFSLSILLNKVNQNNYIRYGEVKIFNILGQLVYHKLVDINSDKIIYKIMLPKFLTTGVYLCNFDINGKNKTYKFTVIR